MGSTLSDGVSQGSAGPDEFRTAPLWGLGQRLFLLHDGRTRDLMQTIAAHQTDCDSQRTSFGGCTESEANQVIQNFNELRQSQKQDILNFLRSL
jgi:CxxC motif-containing protein (DUF1111 family)